MRTLEIDLKAIVSIKSLLLAILVSILLALVSTSSSYRTAAFSTLDQKISTALHNKADDLEVIWIFTLGNILFLAASIAADYSGSVELKGFGKYCGIVAFILTFSIALLVLIITLGIGDKYIITDDFFFMRLCPQVFFGATLLTLGGSLFAFMYAVTKATKTLGRS